MNHLTVVYDACVLYPAPLRSFLMYLACEMYDHFLHGNGSPMTIDYDKYLKSDKAGMIEENYRIIEAKKAVQNLAGDKKSGTIQITSNATGEIAYPRTENWQKTIGAHYIWSSADVEISEVNGKIHYKTKLLIHMEDRYSFNPGKEDIATGIPDSANGRFEITGLAKQFDVFRQAEREVEWDSDQALGVDPSISDNRHTGSAAEPDPTRDRSRRERGERADRRNP